MRTVLIGVVGSVLLIVGSLAGVGGLGLLITDSCSPTYRLSMQPVDSVADPPERTVTYAELTDVQRPAVDAALANQSRMTVRNRAPLAALTESVIKKDGMRYVATLVTVECRTPFDEIAIAGFASAVCGGFLLGFAFILRRHA